MMRLQGRAFGSAEKNLKIILIRYVFNHDFICYNNIIIRHVFHLVLNNYLHNRIVIYTSNL